MCRANIEYWLDPNAIVDTIGSISFTLESTSMPFHHRIKFNAIMPSEIQKKFDKRRSVEELSIRLIIRTIYSDQAVGSCASSSCLMRKPFLERKITC